MVIKSTTAIETLIPRLLTVLLDEPPSFIRKNAPRNKLANIAIIKKIMKYLIMIEERALYTMSRRGYGKI